ncbi:MAG: pyrroline-5-carboxylate reductase [Phycisphaeraceae bacterium]|nr:pyrroline-5-carboxylate reductase [Phycisphaeraceae bacterium]
MASTHLAILGGGTMARAIVEGGTLAGALDPDALIVAEPDSGRRAMFPRAAGSIGEAMSWLIANEPEAGAGQVLLAFKPQSLAQAGVELRAALHAPGRIVLSLLAGASTQRIRAAVGDSARVVRIMPNTPARIGRAMTAISPGAGTRQGDDEFAIELFQSLGRIVRIDETLMDAFTALAGSGPAYVFYLAQGMEAAARSLGFSQDQARLIVSETMAGAGLLLAEEPRDAAALREAVTSKGGTTQAATDVLDRASVMESIIEAVTAARDRGRELGRG